MNRRNCPVRNWVESQNDGEENAVWVTVSKNHKIIYKFVVICYNSFVGTVGPLAVLLWQLRYLLIGKGGVNYVCDISGPFFLCLNAHFGHCTDGSFT